jgi:formylglycine-generating enzyme required for sulfatase activity
MKQNMIYAQCAAIFLLLFLFMAGLQARTQNQKPANIPPPAGWTDPATLLTWTTADNGANVTWNEANDYCSNLGIDGYSDWRVPTIEELKSLYDANTGDMHVKGNLKLSSGYQWTSTQKGASEARIFDFIAGRPSYKLLVLRTFNRTLCVRH